MHSKFIRFAVGASVALSLFSLVGIAQAASLTSTQIDAIIGLLQSFGADQQTVNNVALALDGQPTTNISSSCINLAYNLYAGMTDSQSNGEVSQLQQFLGIVPTGYFGPMTQEGVQNWQSSHSIISYGSPDTTGYGFVGPQTRQVMGCGSQVTQPTQPTSLLVTSLYPVEGPVGTQVTLIGNGFTQTGNIVHFGNGAIENISASPTIYNCPMIPAGSTSGCTAQGSYMLTFTVPSYLAPYCAPGTACPQYVQLVTPGMYNVSIQNSNGTSNALTFTVTSGSSMAPSATINQSSLASSSGSPTITGTAANVSSAGILVKITGGNGSFANINAFGAGVSNGQWSVQLSVQCVGSSSCSSQPLAPGNYSIAVYNNDANGTNGSVLASGILTVNPQQGTSGASGAVSLLISPVSGSNMTLLPRTMAVSASYPLTSCGNPSNPPSFTVNFGDGTTEALSYAAFAITTDGPGGCIAEWSGANHSYTAAGTYTAMLYQNGTPVATQVITITGSTY